MPLSGLFCSLSNLALFFARVVQLATSRDYGGHTCFRHLRSSVIGLFRLMFVESESRFWEVEDRAGSLAGF